MALDSLAWHFGNWYSKRLARETEAGQRELRAVKAANIFNKSYRLVLPNWTQLGRSNWHVWLSKSDLDRKMGPFDYQMWKICGRSSDFGLESYWLEYARANPDRVV